MLKKYFVTLSALIVVGTATQAFANIGEVLVTTTDAEFVTVGGRGEFDHAYRDSKGTIWSHTVVEQVENAAGEPRNRVRYMVQSSQYLRERGILAQDDTTFGALEYCQSIGAELPTREDYVRLRESMGARAGSVLNIEGYQAQILPGLDEENYWSTEYRNNKAEAYEFDGLSGYIDHSPRYQLNAVRCVRR